MATTYGVKMTEVVEGIMKKHKELIYHKPWSRDLLETSGSDEVENPRENPSATLTD